MGPRHKRLMHLEALEGRWLMSASSGYSEEHHRDVDVANDAPLEVAAQDQTARDAHGGSASRRGIERRDGPPASIAEALLGLGGGKRPISPHTENPTTGSPGEIPEKPTVAYVPSTQKPAVVKSPAEAQGQKDEATKDLRDVPLVQAPGSDNVRVIDPRPSSNGPDPITNPPREDQGQSRKPELVPQTSQGPVVTSQNRPSAEVVPPENMEPTSADETEGSETRAEKVVAENSQDQSGVESNTPTQDTVSASPLGSAGMPVERAVDEPGNLAPADEARADEVSIDISSAAVAAFWSALDMLPLASISAVADDSDDGLAATVIANFDSLTAAVDTLLDSLAAQFDLSGPGRMRDILFASSAALLTALACEKVRRRQQRLEDENLTSLGFDADGYLSLAEGL